MSKYKVGDFVLYDPVIKKKLCFSDQSMEIIRVAHKTGNANPSTWVQFYDVEWFTVNKYRQTDTLPEHFLIPDLERTRKKRIASFLKD